MSNLPDLAETAEAMTMNKFIPLWKAEFDWLSECYSQCLQQSVLNLGVAFGNFFDGLCMYPTFKKRQGKQSIQYPQNVKVLSNCEIKFPGELSVVEAKVHRDIEGKRKSTTVEAVFVEGRSPHSPEAGRVCGSSRYLSNLLERELLLFV